MKSFFRVQIVIFCKAIYPLLIDLLTLALYGNV